MSLFRQNKTAAVPEKQLTDEEIVQRVLQDGEQQLLEVLYDRYASKIFHKCVSIIKDREAAKDCTHDIMVKVFMNLINYKGRSAFSLWVHSISYNYCMDYLQKQKRLQYNDYEESEYEHMATDDIELENKIMRDLQLTQLETVFEQLNPEEKIVLMMRYQDGMSVKEVAEALNVGESAVKMRLKRSRDHLAVLINDLERKRR